MPRKEAHCSLGAATESFGGFQVKGKGHRFFNLERIDLVSASRSDHVLRNKFMIFKLIICKIQSQQSYFVNSQ